MVYKAGGIRPWEPRGYPDGVYEHLIPRNMLVWRYMDFQYGVESALTGRFKLAKIAELNDAYEMRGACIGKLKPHVEAELIEKTKKMYVSASDTDASGNNKRPLNEVLSDIRTKPDQYLNAIILRRNVVESRQRVLCFTEATIQDTRSEMLLWAHYANKGSGVRVLMNLFETPKSPFLLRRVRYTEDRPVLNISQFDSWIDEKVFGEYFEAMLFTKGLGWEYEHEVRMVTWPDKNIVEHDEDENMDFVNIDVNCIWEVDFGPMATIEETQKITSDIKGMVHLRHIRCRAARFDERQYRYNYEDL